MGTFLVRTAILATILIGLPFSVSADTLFLSPARATTAVGQTLSVKVFVSSPSKAVNAFSSTIKFPVDKFKVDSISKVGSILTLWVEEPTFSNSEGTVKFEGVIPNPGYTGSSGTLVTINFKSLAKGTAEVKFSGGAVLANDGNGTNILRNSIGGTYEISAAAPVKPAPVAPPVEPPAEPPVKLPEQLKTPEITYYISKVFLGSPFVVQGITSSKAKVQVYLESEGMETIKINTTADSTGKFFVNYEEPIPEGKYKFYAVAQNELGDKSLPSDKKSVTVTLAEGPKPLLSFSQLMWILALILLILSLFLFLWARKRVRDVKKEIIGELEEMEDTVDKTFQLPREYIENNIDAIERNQNPGNLTYEQGKAVSKINDNLANTEKEIIKEIRKIEKDIDKI